MRRRHDPGKLRERAADHPVTGARAQRLGAAARYPSRGTSFRVMKRYIAYMRRSYSAQLRRRSARWMYLGVAAIFAFDSVLFFTDERATVLASILACMAVVNAVLCVLAFRIQRRQRV